MGHSELLASARAEDRAIDEPEEESSGDEILVPEIVPDLKTEIMLEPTTLQYI